MKKYILFFTLALALLMPATLFAFNSRTKGYIEGNIGLSVGKTTTNSTGVITSSVKDEMKTNPLNLNAEIGYYINKSFSFGFSFGYNSFELTETTIGTETTADDTSLTSLLGTANKAGVLDSPGTLTVNINKFRSLFNIAYHYNINRKFNVFLSPAIGFDVNTQKGNNNAFDYIPDPISFDAKLSLGIIYNIKGSLYYKTNVSYNYSRGILDTVFDAVTKDSDDSPFKYEGGSHTWNQFNIGIGAFF